MRRDYHNWLSPRLERQMELLVFGHAGTPVVVFPTTQGRFYEYEDSGMVSALEGKINAGQIQLFCVDSVDSESWLNRAVHPHERVRRQVTYEQYVLEELVPLIRGVNGPGLITVTGCSLGGYQSVNLTLRHPDLVASCISMSGIFDLKRFMDDYYDEDFYFNNPVDYLANTTDPWFLERYGKLKLVLAAGDHDESLSDNRHLAQTLANKNVAACLDVWSGKPDQWALWRAMALKLL
jgi:esterase/lipase superfamily enzyme